MAWRDLAEHQIQKAKAEGQLDDLSGQGEPLEMQGCDDIVSAGLAIMAQAGVLPREIALKKAVAAQRRVLADTTDPDARKAEMGRLADLELHLNIEQDARRRFYRTS